MTVTTIPVWSSAYVSASVAYVATSAWADQNLFTGRLPSQPEMDLEVPPKEVPPNTIAVGSIIDSYDVLKALTSPLASDNVAVGLHGAGTTKSLIGCSCQ
jgi:hypothetical protein